MHVYSLLHGMVTTQNLAVAIYSSMCIATLCNNYIAICMYAKYYNSIYVLYV